MTTQEAIDRLTVIQGVAATERTYSLWRKDAEAIAVVLAELDHLERAEEIAMQRKWWAEPANGGWRVPILNAETRSITSKQFFRFMKEVDGKPTPADALIAADEWARKNLPCDHEWVDARNKAVLSGEVCPKCGAIREQKHGPS